MNKIVLGDFYGFLIPLKSEGKSSGNTKYLCQCVCGEKVSVRGRNLTTGKTQSCGCLSNLLRSKNGTIHGNTKRPLYNIWRGMVARATNPMDKYYPRYGGRGIGICEEWLNLDKFEADMLEGYAQGLTIERVDNSKGYSPDNCVWADRTTQANNRRNNRLLTHDGVTLTVSQWADKFGINKVNLVGRLRRMDEKTALTMPQRPNKYVTVGGVRMTLAEAAREVDVPYTTLVYKYNKGILPDGVIN